jgi:hypothetical protein
MSEETRNLKSEIRNPKMDLDVVLHEYFRSEMPQPWPALAGLKIEDGGSRIEDRGWRIEGSTSNIGSYESTDAGSLSFDPQSSILHPRSSSRSRLVLAASVALLFIGSWWIGQRLSTAERSLPATSSGKMIGSKLQPGKNKSARPSAGLPVR